MKLLGFIIILLLLLVSSCMYAIHQDLQGYINTVILSYIVGSTYDINKKLDERK